jgi:hypothetical protein
MRRAALTLLELSHNLTWLLRPHLPWVRFCPNFSMAPALAIMWMVAGVALKRRASE